MAPIPYKSAAYPWPFFKSTSGVTYAGLPQNEFV